MLDIMKNQVLGLSNLAPKISGYSGSLFSCFFICHLQNKDDKACLPLSHVVKIN